MVRALELFCGIGGFAAAVRDSNVRLVAAFDQNREALDVYSHNCPNHEARRVDLERVSAWELTTCAADLWWLSPPCQPYCERGRQRDLDDPRARSLLHLLEIIERLPENRLPHCLALENVAGFKASGARKRLLEALTTRGYHLQEILLCPTQLGVPSRRPRYYLAASRGAMNPVRVPMGLARSPLSGYLDFSPTEEYPECLLVSAEILTRFGKGLRILDPDDPLAYTTCFTSGYGRSIINAGSYLQCRGSVRRFSPEEIARLLHFPAGFGFPEGMALRKKWHLVGNSLSIIAVQTMLTAFPDIVPGQRQQIIS